MIAGDDNETDAPAPYRAIGRWPYLAASIPLLLIEYAAALLPRVMAYQPSGSRSPIFSAWLEGNRFAILLAAIGAIVFACTATLGWLATRRAATVGATGLTASLAVVPWLQLFVVPILAFREPAERVSPGSLVALRGALWGLGIALAAEFVFTLAFGEYGIALFAGSPFVVGLIAAYFAERDGHPHPFVAAQNALVLASAVLFGFAFEGLFCLVIAYPLATVAALIGSAAGVPLARWRTRSATALSSIALLPLLLIAETAAPPLAEFRDVRSVEVAAAPASVWEAIVNMGTIREAPAAPFGWGLAYPVAGRIDGTGIGAVRLGVFSTGIAHERVTRWEPGRELWFDVLSDPPMMRETNPFGPVRSPHLEGYFATRTAHFTLTPLPGGRTKLTLATDHALMLGPTTYFEPLARWTVAENKRRVLQHFKSRAERSVAAR